MAAFFFFASCYLFGILVFSGDTLFVRKFMIGCVSAGVKDTAFVNSMRQCRRRFLFMLLQTRGKASNHVIGQWTFITTSAVRTRPHPMFVEDGTDRIGNTGPVYMRK